MSSTENKAEVVTNKVEENVQEKEKGSGDLKSETSPQKRTASELNSAEDVEVKQKVLKTDHKEKENGESEEKYEEGGEEDDDDEEVGPEGEGDDFDEEGDEDGADEEEDEDDV